MERKLLDNKYLLSITYFVFILCNKFLLSKGLLPKNCFSQCFLQISFINSKLGWSFQECKRRVCFRIFFYESFISIVHTWHTFCLAYKQPNFEYVCDVIATNIWLAWLNQNLYLIIPRFFFSDYFLIKSWLSIFLRFDNYRAVTQNTYDILNY